MKKAILGFFLFLLMLAIPASHSFTLLGYMWQSHYFEYYINPKNHDVSADAAVFNIKKGAAQWKSWCRIDYMGTVDTHSVRNDGINTVFFRNEEYGALATTYIYNERGRILGFDMVFWDAAWQFFRGDSSCVEGFYIADVATHEFGHALGLGHSGRKSATMYPSCGYCNNTIRSLADDDMNAATRLYGVS